MSSPAHTMLSVQQYLTKSGMTPLSHPPYSPDLILSNMFFVPLDEKSPQREIFCQCGKTETKNSRSTKRHQNSQVQKLF